MGPRFAIRGVIYELRAFLQPALSGKSIEAAGGGKDCGAASLSSSSSAAAGSVAAADVIAGLGIGGMLPGVEERVVSDSQPRKEKLEESLEVLIGAREGMRAKYAGRLMAKKMAADLRREQQGRFGVEAGDGVFHVSRSSNDKFEAVRGSMALVGYLQDRGVLQALVAPNNANEELASLDELLHRFRFDCVKNTEDGLSEDVVSSLCSKWSLPANQVMVVVSADLITDILNPAGIFKCRVTSAKVSAVAEEKFEKFAPSNQEIPRKTGTFQWLQEKIKDLQQISPEPVLRPKDQFDAHYNVRDMTELKELFEELNGISYRPEFK